jgi:hypothetical protein
MKMKFYFGVMALFITLLFAGCFEFVDAESGVLTELGTISKDLWGEWIRMDTGDTWYIGNNYISGSGSSNVILSKQSEKVIEVSDSGRKYYLYASRTANASFSGMVAGVESNNASFSGMVAGVESNLRAIGRPVAGGKGWLDVVVKDLNSGDQKITKTDEDGKFAVDNAIPGDNYEITPEGGIPTVVTPIADGDDIGTITITNDVNFKTTIKPRSSSLDMTRLYVDINSYELDIEVENTGTADCYAATYNLDFPDDLIAESVPESTILGTIEPGKKKTIEIKVKCQPVQNEYEYKKIGVIINDPISGKTWDDSISVKFNKAPVNFNIRSNKPVSGIVIAPTAKAYPFNNVTSAKLEVPWSTKDYLIVFSGATADTEATYSLGIDVMPDSDFNALRNPGIYEPNNTEHTATRIMNQEKIMSYLHKNDIDYYKVNLGPR